MERFDFLVQERTLSELEGEEYRHTLEGKDASQLAPHRVAALEALRKLTGKDAGPTSKAWRETLTSSTLGRKSVEFWEYQIETSMVFINPATSTAPDLLFGGVMNSGYGRELSDLGIGEFVKKKLIRVA